MNDYGTFLARIRIFVLFRTSSAAQEEGFRTRTNMKQRGSACPVDWPLGTRCSHVLIVACTSEWLHDHEGCLHPCAWLSNQHIPAFYFHINITYRYYTCSILLLYSYYLRIESYEGEKTALIWLFFSHTVPRSFLKIILLVFSLLPYEQLLLDNLSPHTEAEADATVYEIQSSGVACW